MTETEIVISLIGEFERTGDQDFLDAAELIRSLRESADKLSDSLQASYAENSALRQTLEAIIALRNALPDRRDSHEAGYADGVEDCADIAEAAIHFAEKAAIRGASPEAQHSAPTVEGTEGLAVMQTATCCPAIQDWESDEEECR